MVLYSFASLVFNLKAFKPVFRPVFVCIIPFCERTNMKVINKNRKKVE